MLRDIKNRESCGFGGDHCLAPSRSVDAPVDGASGRYERLFPELTALEGEGEALLALGTAGGICDGSESCEDAAETAAGWPLFGQFIAHDITADRSPLTPRAELSDAINFRSPRADLECLYGSGQVGSPFLYRRDDPALLLLGRNERGEEADLPRNAEGVALIGDPRNDVHVVVSQLHVAMIKVHNRLVERARERGIAGAEVFATARRETIWHYQWVIVNDYLPRSAPSWSTPSSSAARASTIPTVRRGSRSSSRMRRSGTDTARSATSTSSTRARTR
jgi:hypothetical protein